jgi:hypothetical protein
VCFRRIISLPGHVVPTVGPSTSSLLLPCLQIYSLQIAMVELEVRTDSTGHGRDPPTNGQCWRPQKARKGRRELIGAASRRRCKGKEIEREKMCFCLYGPLVFISIINYLGGRGKRNM